MPRKDWDNYPAPVRDERTGCLRWQGPIHSHGYGKVGSKRYAHIVAWEREVGPVPEGHQLDHVATRGCEYRDCVEIAHLEPVTQAENIRRQAIVIDRKSRKKCPAGHRYEGKNLIIRRGCRECRTCVYERNAAARKRRREAKKSAAKL